MKLLIPPGTTSKIVRVFAQDSTTGLAKIGIAANAWTWWWSKVGGTAPVQVSSISAGAIGTWVSGNITEIDATKMPGIYEVCLPDASLSGATVHHCLTGTGFVVSPIEIQTDNAPTIVESYAASLLGTDNFPLVSNDSIWGKILSSATSAGTMLTAVWNWITGNTKQTGDSYSVVNSGSFGNSALLTALQNIQNNTFISSTIPQILERPDSSSTSISISVVFADETGAAKNLDSGNPSATLVNDAGTDKSGRLGAWSNPSTGKYVIVYTNTSTDTIEGLHWDITGTVNSKARRYVAFTQIVDTTAVSYTSSDRTTAAATAAAVTALGSPMQAGTTVNTNANATELAIKVKTDLIATNSADSPNAVTAQGNIAANPDSAGVASLLLRLTNARAGYLDNLNVGGVLASHADVLAINTSSSKHIILTTVGQYERPESGSVVYTVEARTFSAIDGTAANADSTPTLTATGQTSGSLAANVGTVTNPATGVYRATYTVLSSATNEPVRFDVSATISSATFTLSAYTQVLDEVSVTWTATNASQLAAVYNKLPANGIADETLVLAAVGTPMQAGATVNTNANATELAIKMKTDQLTFTVSGHVDATATATVDSNEIAAAVVTGIEDAGLTVNVGSFSDEAMAQFATALSTARITVVNQLVVNGETKTIYVTSGDEISLAMGNAISITLTGNFPDISGWSSRLLIKRDGIVAYGTGSVVSANSSTIVLSAAFTATETIKLREGTGKAQLRFFNGSSPATVSRDIEAIVSEGLVPKV